MNTEYPLIKELIPFPLLTHELLEQYCQDEQVKGHLNQLILSLNHKCQYKWMNQMKEDWSEFENEIKILSITWNMHGLLPSYSLKRLFQIGTIHHDLIVVGTQECSRSIAVSLFCESKQSWESKLQEELGKSYIPVSSTSLNAMHLIAFAHVSLIPKIRNGTSHKLSQGFMNFVGNKGGVAISMTINDKHFLFVNSHLESGQNAQLTRSLQFNTLHSYFDFQCKQNTKSAKINYNYLIWCGDFNSRIEIPIINSTIKQQSNFLEWLCKDQMHQNRITNNKFQQDFKEGMIFFPPTYKLQENINQWCVGADYRIPGWCDRILFKENDQQFELDSQRQVLPKNNDEELIQHLKLHNYDANFEILGSDHRPVFAQFTAVI